MKVWLGRALVLGGALALVFWGITELARWNHVSAYVVAAIVALLTGASLLGSSIQKEKP